MAFSNNEIQHLSIIIITHNRKEDLSRCLGSVREQNHNSYETIVVDNNSTDGTASMVREEYEWVNYIGLDENIGIAARNQAVKEATGDVLVTLDDDSEFATRNTLVRIAEIFKKNANLGAAGFRIIDGDGEEEDWFEWPMVGNVQMGYRSPTFETCGAALRPEVFERTNGFWEPFFIYVEERDISTRIINSGGEIRYFPRISIIHHRSKINRNESDFLYYVSRNTLWYIWRNFPVLPALKKTVCHAGRMLWKVFKKREGFGIVLKGFVDAVGAIGAVWKTRDPIDQKYMDWVDGRFETESDGD